MWTGSVTGTHADNWDGIAGQASLARFTLLWPLTGCAQPVVGMRVNVAPTFVTI